MMLCGVSIALGILAFCCSGSMAVDCNSQDSVMYAQRLCFHRYGLEMAMGSVDIHHALQDDPEATCRNESSYERAIRCALGVSKQCLEELGQSPGLLPDVDNVILGITYLCSNIDKIHGQCVKDKSAAVKQCAMRKALLTFAGPKNPGITHMNCRAFDITRQCLEEVLVSCSRQTADIYIHLTREYLTHVICRRNAAANPTPFPYLTTLPPTTPFQLVTWMPITTYVSCSSASSIEDGQKKCFQQEGITVEISEFFAEDGKFHKQSYLDAVIANKGLQTVCSQLRRYQRATGCAMNVALDCLSDSYKDYTVSPRQAQMMLSELCDNADEINEQCVISKAAALFDCGYKYGKTIRTKDVKTILCLAYKYNAKCLQEVLPACGQSTVRVYVDIAKRFLNPPGCPAIDLTGGVAGHGVGSVGLLAMATLLARLM